MVMIGRCRKFSGVRNEVLVMVNVCVISVMFMVFSMFCSVSSVI